MKIEKVLGEIGKLGAVFVRPINEYTAKDIIARMSK